LEHLAGLIEAGGHRFFEYHADAAAGALAGNFEVPVVFDERPGSIRFRLIEHLAVVFEERNTRGKLLSFLTHIVMRISDANKLYGGVLDQAPQEADSVAVYEPNYSDPKSAVAGRLRPGRRKADDSDSNRARYRDYDGHVTNDICFDHKLDR